MFDSPSSRALVLVLTLASLLAGRWMLKTLGWVQPSTGGGTGPSWSGDGGGALDSGGGGHGGGCHGGDAGGDCGGGGDGGGD